MTEFKAATLRKAECGSNSCTGCYEIEPGVRIHPPKNGLLDIYRKYSEIELGADGYPYNWKEISTRVRTETGGLCTNCKTRENVGVHHIDHDKVNCEHSNMEVLCWPCHTEQHRKDAYQFTVSDSGVHGPGFYRVWCERRSLEPDDQVTQERFEKWRENEREK